MKKIAIVFAAIASLAGGALAFAAASGCCPSNICCGMGADCCK